MILTLIVMNELIKYTCDRCLFVCLVANIIIGNQKVYLHPHEKDQQHKQQNLSAFFF